MHKLKILSVISVLLLSCFLRIYNVTDQFLFTIDEEYHFNFAQTIVGDFHVIFSGMTVSVGFYMGPFLIYFTSLFLQLFNDLSSFGYLAAFFGVLTTGSIFLTGTRLFNFKVGFLASLLYATLPLFVLYDQRYWNNTPIPFLAVIMFLSLVSSFRDQRWWIVFAAAIGVMFHTNLSLFPFALISGWVLFSQRKLLSKKILALALATFFLIYSPLLVFDYYHNYDNLRFPLKLLNRENKVGGDGGINLSIHAQALLQTLGRVWYLTPGSLTVDEVHWGCSSTSGSGVEPGVDRVTTKTTSPFWLSGLALTVILWFLIRKSTWREKGTQILSLLLISFFSFFLFFPGGAFEYYLLGAFPLFVFSPVLLWNSLPKARKTFVSIAILLMIALGINTILKSNSSLGLADQKSVVIQVMKAVGNQPFALEESGGCRKYAGWRYLFKKYGRVPVQSSIDNTFGWLYPNEISSGKAKYQVIVSETRIEPSLSFGNAIRVSQGGFQAFIIKLD